jgi:hypothetical protein
MFSKPSSQSSRRNVGAILKCWRRKQLSALWITMTGSSRKWKKALAQIERGEVLSHEEVGARLDKLLSSDKHSRA